MRRLPVAAALALATAFLLGSVLVAARAGSDREDEMPERMAIPAPAIGDRWSYDAMLEGPWLIGPNDTVQIGEPFRYADFEWLEPRLIRDGSGMEVAVDVLNVTYLSYYPDLDHQIFTGGRLWTLDHTMRFHRLGEPEAIAREDLALRAGSSSGADATLAGFLPVQQTESEEASGFQRHFGLFDAPCLSRTAFQGETMDLRRPLAFEGFCLPPFDQEWDDPFRDASLRADAMEPVLGVQAVRFAASGIQVWYSESVPVPLQVRAVQGDRSITLTLASWEPGRDPVGSRGPTPAITAAPVLRMAPRQIWGPDDSGVNHPFPASVAFQTAQSDPAWPDLREWLQNHPKGAAVFLEPGFRKDGTHEIWSWGFVLEDGTEAFSFTASKTVYLGLPALSVVTFESSEWWAAFMHPLLMTPDQMPSELPTVASLLATWDSYRDTEGLAGEGNGWVLSLMCYEACAYNSTLVAAGWNPAVSNIAIASASDPAFSLEPEGESEGSQLDVDASGRLDAFTTWIRVRETETQLGPLSDEGPDIEGSATVEEEDRGLLLGTALFPGPAGTTAVGIASALVGLAYWFWPTLKNGLFAGLFSRTKEDRLLEHPVRRRLVDLVEANPGIHFQELVRGAEAGNGTVVHHLRKLVAAGLLVEKRGQAYTCYFPPGRSVPVAAVEATKSAGAQQVLEAIRNRPGVSGKEIAAALGVGAPTVHHHTQRLLASGLVASLRDGRAVRFHATATAGGAAASA